MDVKVFLHSDRGESALQWIAAVARRAAECAQAFPEDAKVSVGSRSVYAQPGGYCCRFVREVHEVAFGSSWPFRSGTAAETEKLLAAAGRRLSGRIPGAIGFWSMNDAKGRPVGHVVVYLGGELCAENTSSGGRGAPLRPGTKITTMADVLKSHKGDPGRWYYGGPVS